MNITIEKFVDKFNSTEPAICIPDDVVVGMDQNDSQIAAISGRWMQDTWVNASAFKNHCGFQPSCSKTSAIELRKAATGKAFHVQNEWHNGFKVCLSTCCQNLDNRRVVGMPLNREGHPAGLFVKKRYADFSTIVVEDSRGWNAYVSVDNLLGILEAERCGLGAEGELSCELCYGLSKNGFMLLSKKLAAKLNAIDEKKVAEDRKAFNIKQKKKRDKLALEDGKFYMAQDSDTGKKEKLFCLGKLPNVYDHDLLHQAIDLSYVADNSVQNASTLVYSNYAPWKNKSYKECVTTLREKLNSKKWTFLKVNLGSICATSQSKLRDNQKTSQMLASFLAWPFYETYMSNANEDGNLAGLSLKFSNVLVWSMNGIAIVQLSDKQAVRLSESSYAGPLAVSQNVYQYRSTSNDLKPLSQEDVDNIKHAVCKKHHLIETALNAFVHDLPIEEPEDKDAYFNSILSPAFKDKRIMAPHRTWRFHNDWDWKIFG